MADWVIRSHSKQGPRDMEAKHTPHNSRQRVVEEEGMEVAVDQEGEEEEKDIILIGSQKSKEEGEAADVVMRAFQLQNQQHMIVKHSKDNKGWTRY